MKKSLVEQVNDLQEARGSSLRVHVHQGFSAHGHPPPEVRETTDEHNKRLFAHACARAQRESKDDECTKHVNAIVGIDGNGTPVFVRFYPTDWYSSDSTLRTYHFGEQR